MGGGGSQTGPPNNRRRGSSVFRDNKVETLALCTVGPTADNTGAASRESNRVQTLGVLFTETKKALFCLFISLRDFCFSLSRSVSLLGCFSWLFL